MSGPTYPAARRAAPRIHALFSEHAANAVSRGHHPVATVPDADAIEAIVSAGFWSSLRREESYVPRISLAFVAPHETLHPLLFERRLPLESAPLARIAPAVERRGIHLGVWPDGGSLTVWGTTRTIPVACFVLEVAAPGLLVVKHHRGGDSKYANVAVFEADHIKIVDEQASSLPDCPGLLASLVGFESPASWADSMNVLVQLAVSMRAHGRGGLLLVVPQGSEAWRDSIVRPIAYAVAPPFEELAAICRVASKIGDRPEWHDALARAIDAVAGLTAVDGATVVTTEYEVLAFGAKIIRRKGSPLVDQVTVTEPVEGAPAALADPTELGGTRHLSAAQFVHDQRDAVALVASQDGRFTVFAWSPREAMVHAHRVETLLL